ncbi:hypothetical protein [Corynebacterium fournieri]|uniref:hypothetical protein n=1 Tax=Corynebacterium fournieri TaxID=1852390 RepID=UPI000A2F1D5D|nr:hypothetical protein [Corynebacterium fournieri]WJY97991.1 hypothetical protein CFOUR_07925 [Corynebacterium fournieri]
MTSTVDAELLHSALTTLKSAGVVLADGIEAEDVEDAVADYPALFPTRPFAVLSQVASNEDETLFVLSQLGSLDTRATRACTAAGVELWDIAVVPDFEGSAAGSARVRFSEWDVADVAFDGPSPCFELGILAAVAARAL